MRREKQTLPALMQLRSLRRRSPPTYRLVEACTIGCIDSGYVDDHPLKCKWSIIVVQSSNMAIQFFPINYFGFQKLLPCLFLRTTSPISPLRSNEGIWRENVLLEGLGIPEFTEGRVNNIFIKVLICYGLREKQHVFKTASFGNLRRSGDI